MMGSSSWSEASAGVLFLAFAKSKKGSGKASEFSELLVISDRGIGFFVRCLGILKETIHKLLG